MLIFKEKDGIDFQLIMVLFFGGEEVFFFFMVKNFIGIMEFGFIFINSFIDFVGDFNVFFYWGVGFLDFKVWGLYIGYDNVVVLFLVVDKFCINKKEIFLGKGIFFLQVIQVDGFIGEIVGIFESE